MSSNALLEHKVDRLEEALIHLSEEMINFKNEMRYDFAQYKEENREEHKKQNHDNAHDAEQLILSVANNR